MCNPKLLAVAAIGGALFTGGASLGLLGAGASAAVGAGAGAASAAAATAAATGTTAAATMTAMQGVSLAASIASTGLAAAGAWQQSETQQKIADANAKQADINAQSAIDAGERDAQAVQRKASQVTGAQRAGMAAKGLDIADTGTATDLLDQTSFFAAQDVATARTNARKQAYNFQAQGAGFQAQAEGYSPLMAASTSMLGGAGQVADKWYRYNGS